MSENWKLTKNIVLKKITQKTSSQGLRHALLGGDRNKGKQKQHLKTQKQTSLAAQDVRYVLDFRKQDKHTQKHIKTQKQKSSAAQGVRYAWGGREAGQTHTQNTFKNTNKNP